MFKAKKILWGEGLFLRPQHFQLQDAYHEQRTQHFIHAIQPYAYGIQSLIFDEAQLKLNILALESVNMIWQDGEIYSAPQQDLLPESIQLDQFKMEGEMLVFLAFAHVQAMKQNVNYNSDAQPNRYHVSLYQTHDIYTDAAPAEISVLNRRAAFKLRPIHYEHQHEDDGFIYIPIAKIRRDNTGQYDLDPYFIPPILHIKASDFLMQGLKRYLNVIQAKITAIQSNNRENEQKLIEFRSGDIVSFWLINALNCAYASLHHLYQHPQFHPERLYHELLRLIGSLLTFSTAYELNQLPRYQHEQLFESFNGLDLILRDLLDTIISNRYISIQLKETRPSYWVGSLESDKITRDSRLYLAVSSQFVQTHELIQIVPLRFKVGNSDDVEQCVISALPAVPLHHLMQVPTAIPVRSGISYFELEPHHAFYQRMLASQSICIYIPSGFQDTSVELIALLQR